MPDCCPRLNEVEARKDWEPDHGLGPVFGLQIKLEVEALWSCSLFIFSWNWCGNKCRSVGMPSRKVLLPRSVRLSEKRRCLQTFKRAFALPSKTRASSSISRTTSGSGPPSPSSLGGESRFINAAKIGLATVRKGPCCSARPSSKEKTSLVFRCPMRFPDFFLHASFHGGSTQK